MMSKRLLVACWLLLAIAARGGEVDPLAIGIAGHAFDHLGNIGDQADAAAASGANIIYDTGFGAIGYGGLPAPAKLAESRRSIDAYVRHAKEKGIRRAIGYLCATSIVKLETFDRNWTAEFRAQFRMPPAQWLQQDRNGKRLASWYGGDYRPACMSNPDWRTYEKALVRMQLEAGHDGIFFDNPTVHPQGCYCSYCMPKFAAYLKKQGVKDVPDGVEALRGLALSRPNDFMRFRCTIAADFLAEMRAYARSIKPGTLITCNNSLNTPGAFFSQCRTYGYNIHEMSRVEDLVVVEDMESQPRVLPGGGVAEYGPVYEMLHAIAHDKPVVAVTIAQGDYHTPASLMRLAMAEAAAHGASYMSWPTWPEGERKRMIEAVRPQADFLGENFGLFNHVDRVSDCVVLLPFERYVETADCQVLGVARALSAANVQFEVVSEEGLEARLAKGARVLVVESPQVLSEVQRGWVEKFKAAGGRVVWSGGAKWTEELNTLLEKRAISVEGPATVRAVVRRQGAKTIIHLLNLDVRRVSSFEDRVTPATQVRIRVRCGKAQPTKVRVRSADEQGTRGAAPMRVVEEGGEFVAELTVPRVEVSAIVVIEAL
jgi:hypothetical protein